MDTVQLIKYKNDIMGNPKIVMQICSVETVGKKTYAIITENYDLGHESWQAVLERKNITDYILLPDIYNWLSYTKLKNTNC